MTASADLAADAAAAHAPASRTVMVIGRSHCVAIKEGFELARDALAAEAPHLTFEIAWIFDEAGDGVRGDLETSVALERAEQLGPDDMLVLSLAGTFHNIMGLLQHDEPIDVAPFETGRDIPRTVIPRNMLLDQFEEMNRERRLAPTFKKATKARVFHLDTPPPKADERYIRARMGRYRGTPLADALINPPALRQRIWAAEMEALARVCADWGITPIAPPPEALTKTRHLAPDFYGTDATHANAAYGKLVLEQIVRLAAAPASAPATGGEK